MAYQLLFRQALCDALAMPPAMNHYD